MKVTSPTQARATLPGITLIELTVVILVLLSLIAVLFVGAQAWKRGSDRAGCIVQIRQVQMSVRSFANMNGYDVDQDVSPRDLKGELIGPDAFVEVSPDCPGQGTYKFGKNRIPKIGKLYMTCSLKDGEDHEPAQFKEW